MALDQDEFYRNLSDELKQKVRDNIAACKLSPNFLDDNHKVWHGDIKHCPTCNDIRITSCCACGCGSCYTCNFRFCCTPYFPPLESSVLKGVMKMDQILDGLGLIPDVGSTWTHTNGNIYKVVTIANKDTEYPDKYPVTVVYAGENGKTWSRPLSDWGRSMTKKQED